MPTGWSIRRLGDMGEVGSSRVVTPIHPARHRTSSDNAITPKMAAQTRRRSVIWALLPFLTFGVATPFVIWHAASKLHSRRLRWCAVAWVPAVIVSFAMASSGNKGGVAGAVGTTVLITVMVGGTFQAFALRTAVFRLDSLDVDRTARRTALRIVREHPREAIRLNLGRVDIAEEDRLPDGGLIDVNNSSPAAIGHALGLTAREIDELRIVRDRAGGFSSAADMEVQLDWDPRIFDVGAGRIICLPRLGHRIDPMVLHESTRRADGRSSGVPSDLAGRQVRVASYIWAFFPLATGGIAAAPTMAFAAVRLRSHRLWILSGLYLVAILGLAFTEGLAGPPTGTPSLNGLWPDSQPSIR